LSELEGNSGSSYGNSLQVATKKVQSGSGSRKKRLLDALERLFPWKKVLKMANYLLRYSIIALNPVASLP
jgi:hypothetical protein